MGRIEAMQWGKTLRAVEHAKAAQRDGKIVAWATNDQTGTASLLSKHGALCEVVGDKYLIPHFRTSGKG